jgi:pSer/pThr/pTyr-binding forkhead associated (FHA) protein
MAKLILSFKGLLLSVHHLDERPMTIGRDPACRIAVDSLAIAPRHAELVSSDADFLLLALDPDYPVLLNNEQVDQASLHHGDEIQLGKHTLSFSNDTLELARRPAADRARPPAGGEEDPVPAYLQVQSGPQIGKVVVLRRAVTRLSPVGAKDVLVTRRDNAYHLSRLDGDKPITVGGAALVGDADVALRHNDVIEIGTTRFCFFSADTDIPADKTNQA